MVMWPVLIAPSTKQVGGVSPVVSGSAGTTVLASDMGLYKVPSQENPKHRVPGGKCEEKGFLITFKSVVESFPALIFILCKS